jgi:hypothetical protein
MTIYEANEQLRRECANLADTVIGAGLWRRLFQAVGWKPGQWPTQETDPE